jgi:hypothetical protein
VLISFDRPGKSRPANSNLDSSEDATPTDSYHTGLRLVVGTNVK